MERIRIGINGLKTVLACLAILSLSGCFEDEKTQVKQDVPHKKELPQPPATVKPIEA